MSNLSNLQDELNAAQAVIIPQIEGLQDFARLPLQADTINSVNAATTDFSRRRDLQKAVLDALAALAADGYPDEPNRPVTQAIFVDLQSNLQEMEAAFSKFNSIGQATTVTITPGAPELKPKP